MRRSEKSGNLGPYPAGTSFPKLLAWHLDHGTRRNGEPTKRGEIWRQAEFAREIFGDDSARDSLARSVSNWVRGINQPIADRFIDIKYALFGDKPAYDGWREDLDDAYRVWPKEVGRVNFTGGIGEPQLLVAGPSTGITTLAVLEKADETIAEFQRVVKSSEFQKWQLEAIRVLYIKELQRLNSSIRIFQTIGNHVYPIIIIRSAEDYDLLSASSDDLTVENRPLYPDADVIKNNGLRIDGVDLSESQNEYVSALILARKVTRPNQPGYAMSRLFLNSDGRANGFTAKTCHYMDNVRTCHHLEFVFAKAFQSGIDPRNIAEFADQMGHPSVEIGDDCKSLAVSSRYGMYPLISLQAICLFRRRGQWRVAYVQRGKEVSTAAGSYQFVPAGGFETIGQFDLGNIAGRERDRLKYGFDVQDALLREMLEETFGDEAMADGGGSADIENLPGLLLCRKLLDEKRLEIRSLGVIFDLVRLRPEFSFIIVLRDEKPGELQYVTRTTKDNASVIANFGFTNKREAGELESMSLSELRTRLHNERWHESSAGLGHLALAYLEQNAEFSHFL
jgi:hypothetical protein